MRKVMLAGFLAFAYVLPESAGGAELKQETTEAFNQYVRVTEDRMAEELRDARTFLWVDGFPGPQRGKLYTQLRRGEIVIERLETLEREKRIRVPNGLIHHWVAVSFVPGVTLKQVLTLLQDYDHHEAIYKPDVLRSRLLNADGNCFKIYLRLHQKAILTAVFNAEFDVSYFPLDENRTHSRSYSTRIAELENPDRSDEREKPIGKDRGFLWRLNSYWRFQEKDGGVYVQLESVALSPCKILSHAISSRSSFLTTRATKERISKSPSFVPLASLKPPSAEDFMKLERTSLLEERKIQLRGEASGR